jgi:tetratricopeptide (TPR) repeat protein
MRERSNSIAVASVFFSAVAIYVSTCCRTIFVGDSGELTLALTTGGIAHPPGYPLYTVCGYVWLKLFFFLGPALAANLFSAAAAALTSVILFKLLNKITKNKISFSINAGLALLYAFSRPVWSSATNAEVYAFSGLLYLLALYHIVDYHIDAERKSPIRAFFFCGLVLTHHFSSGVIIAGLLLALIFRKRTLTAKTVTLAPVAFVLPLTVYYYLYARFDPDLPINWMEDRSYSALWGLVSGEIYRKFVGMPNTGDLFLYLRKTFVASFWYFGPGIAFAAIPGLVLALKNNTRQAALFILPALLNLFLIACYHIPDYEGYLIPVIVCAVICIAILVDRLHVHFRFGKPVTMAVAGAIILIPLLFNYSRCDLSDFDLAKRYGLDLLDCAPQNSMLFLKSDNGSHSALYLNNTEEYRSDLEVYSSNSTLTRLKHRYNGKDYARIVDSLEKAGNPIYWGTEYVINQGMHPSFRQTIRRGLLYGPVSGEDLIALEYRLFQIDDLLSQALRNRAAQEIAELYEWGKNIHDPHTCLAVAQFFRVRGMTGQCHKWIQFALNCEPFSYVEKDIYVNMGTVLRQDGDLIAASHALEQALHIDPDYMPALYNNNLIEAESALKRQDWDRALHFFGQLTLLEPDNALPYFNMAVIYERLPDRAAEALQCYRKFLSLTQGEQPAVEKRARDRIAELEN